MTQVYGNLVTAFVLLFAGFSLPAGAVGLERTIVQVSITKQSPSIESPWEKLATKQIQCLGTVVPGGSILVTAFAVSDAKLVEIRLVGSSKVYQAQVKFVDQEANLALLEIAESNALRDLIPVELGPAKPIGSDGNLYSAPRGGRFVLHKAYLSSVGVFKASTSFLNVVNYQYKVQENGLGWSEPIISDGKLIAVTAGQNTEYVFAIPALVIEHFLNDNHDKTYRGFPGLGIATQALEPGNLRTLLDADKIKGGIRVTEVSTIGPFAQLLQKNDVISKINDHPIDGEGLIQDSLWGRLPFPFILNTLYAGDSATISFLRKGTQKTVTAVLTRYNSNARRIPYNRTVPDIPHVVVGGIIFQELTHEYLRAWGDKWHETAPSKLVYLWDHRNEFVDPETKRVVILNRVMADEFNFGFGEINDTIVTQVNERPIESLTELVEALKHPIVRGDIKITKIGLADGNGDIILGYDDIAAANKRVSETYGIGPSAKFFP